MISPAPPALRKTALGLMSGTSLDGIDAALLVTDGDRLVSFGAAATLPFPQSLRDRLRALIGRPPDDGAAVAVAELTDHHAEAVRRLLDIAGIAAAEVDVIGFHGQTVFHRPETGETYQLGDGQRLADLTGISVVADFRTADVAAGGQGAPLVPAYHAALAAHLAKPLAILNIGGVANVTWIGPDAGDASCDVPSPDAAGPAILAFDTGPGNALIDDWLLRRKGLPFDPQGTVAAQGAIDPGMLERWLRDDYFRRRPPKSLDRDAFALALREVEALDMASGAATLTAFTAHAVVLANDFLPAAPLRWLVCGGGRHNQTLMAMLGETLQCPVEPVEVVGWRGDTLEAEAFAYLAVRSLRGLPLTFPTTTGVSRPQSGGAAFTPRRSGVYR